MVVLSEKEAHVVRLTQQLELLVAHPERVGQIVRTPAAEQDHDARKNHHRHVGTITFTFTFMHLADAFIQSDLQLVCVFPGNRTHNLLCC